MASLAAKCSEGLAGLSLRSSTPSRPSVRGRVSVVSVEAKREHRTDARRRRHLRVRKKVSGDEERPRLCVFRSNQHIYAQVIDDTKHHTYVGLGTVGPYVKERLSSSKKSATKNVEAASVVGRLIAERCLEQGIEKVVFDRGGYRYHGKVKQLADSAREAGLQF